MEKIKLDLMNLKFNMEINNLELPKSIVPNPEEEYTEIPETYKRLANLGPYGYWNYWNKQPNGKWKYEPKWIEIEEVHDSQGDEEQIPDVCRTLTQYGGEGSWDYWKLKADGKWKYQPTWETTGRDTTKVFNIYEEEFDSYPSLIFHHMYANLGEGEWSYWRLNNNGKWVWYPRWIDKSNYKDLYQLKDIENNWCSILEEERNIKENNDSELVQSILGRKLSLHSELIECRSKFGITL